MPTYGREYMQDLSQRLSKLYEENPDAFSQDDLAEISNISASFGLRLHDTPAAPEEFDLGRTISKLGTGFLTGFSTIEVGDAPRNDYEFIASNLGHLFGFMGYVPGVGTAGKLAGMAAARVTGMAARGANAVGMAKLAGYVSKAPDLARIKSLPMMGADLAMTGIKNVAGRSAYLKSLNFLAEGATARHMIEGGLHLGIASGISAAQPWELELDRRLEAVKGGIEAGLVFRGIGNLFAKGQGGDLSKVFGNPGDPNSGQLANTIARMVSSAAYMGLPSTMRDDPSPIQVYEYVAGAMFGKMERPAYMEQVAKFMQPYERTLAGQLKLMYSNSSMDEAAIDAKLPGWSKLSPMAKEEIGAMTTERLARWTKIGEETTVGLAMKQYLGKTLDDLVSAGVIKSEEANRYLRSEKIKEIHGEEEARAQEEGLSSEEEIAQRVTQRVFERLAEQGDLLDEVNSRQINTILEDAGISIDVRNELLAKDMKDVVAQFEDQGVPMSFHRPLVELATQLEAAQAEPAEGQARKTWADFEKELVEFAGAKLKSKNIADYTAFKSAVAKHFSMKDKPFEIAEESDTERRLRQVWSRWIHDRKADRITFDPESGAVSEMESIDADGKSTTINKPWSFLVRSTENRVFEMDQVAVLDPRFGRKTMRDLYDSGVDVSEVIAKAYLRSDKNGNPSPLMFIGGVKDAGKILFQRAMAVPFAREGKTVYRYKTWTGVQETTLSDKLASIQAALGEKENVQEVYQKNLEEFLSDYKNVDGTYRFDQQKLTDMYEHLYMNNVALIERMNSGVKIEEMVKHGKKFILKAAAMNKRLQVFHSGDYPMDTTLLKGIADAEGRLPGIIVRVDKDDPGAILKMWTKDEADAVRQAVVETHLDGVFIARSDLFEAIAKSMGQPLDTGGQKVTITFTDPVHGAFVGKLLVHRASPKMNAHLMENSLTYQVYDTAAKQIGNRPTFKERYEGGRIVYYGEDGQKVGTPKIQMPAGQIDPTGKYVGERQDEVAQLLAEKKDISIFDTNEKQAYSYDYEMQQWNEIEAGDPLQGVKVQAEAPKARVIEDVKQLRQELEQVDRELSDMLMDTTVQGVPVPVKTDTSHPIFGMREKPLDYTANQKEALLGAAAFIEAGKGEFVLSGYAGTGKTTIVENIANFARKKGLDVWVTAPTNKAVRVLAGKLPDSVRDFVEMRTIHRTLYGGAERDPITGELKFNESADLGSKDIVLVDEASMIEERVYSDIQRYAIGRGARVIFIGDGFQLEPVGKDPGLMNRPTVVMTEVKRQNLTSNILKLATAMRNLKMGLVPKESGGDTSVVPAKELRDGYIESLKRGEDSIYITATNRDRVAMNTRARAELRGVGLMTEVKDGEPLISIANSDYYPNGETFKANTREMQHAGWVDVPVVAFGGTIQTVKGQMLKGTVLDKATGELREAYQLIVPDYESASLVHQMIEADLASGDPLLKPFVMFNPRSGKKYISKGLTVATYAYAITGHKSQGSQWQNVYIDQQGSNKLTDNPRWLYTAITRASQKLNLSDRVQGEKSDWSMLDAAANQTAQGDALPKQDWKPLNPEKARQAEKLKERQKFLRDKLAEAEKTPVENKGLTGGGSPENAPGATISAGEASEATPKEMASEKATQVAFPEQGIVRIPGDGIRTNPSAAEKGLEGIDDVAAKIQFSGNLPPHLAQEWMKKMAFQSWDGDPAVNRMFEQYLKAKPGERAGIASLMDVDKLSAQTVYDILQGKHSADGAMFRKVAARVLKYHEEIDLADESGTLTPEEKADALALATMHSAAKTILSTGELTPLTLEHDYVRPYFHTLLRNYLRDRVTKVKMPGSWKSKSYAYDPYLQHDYNLQQGEYLAAEGLRVKEVEFDGKKLTLGDLWDSYEKEQNPLRKAAMDDAMQHFVIRVPADSASGIRVMKFRGFVKGSKGYGVYLHPEDMVNLGGMDQDGDAVDVYTRVPDKELNTQLREYFYSMKDQWFDPVVRLYRGETTKPSTELPAWMKGSKDVQGMAKASGRWFTDDKVEAQWYIDNEHPDGTGKLTYVDVPKSVAEKYRVSNLKDEGTDAPNQFSRRPDKEIFLPRELADKRQDWADGIPEASKFMRGSSKKDFLTTEQIDGKRLSSVTSLADPRSLLRINRWAYQGNTMLGPGLVHIRNLMELIRHANKSNGSLDWQVGFREEISLKAAGKLPGMENLSKNQQARFQQLAELYAKMGRKLNKETLRELYELNDKTGTSGFQYHGTPADIGVMVESMRDLVNTSADAADGDPLKARQDVLSMLSAKAFPKMEVSYKLGAQKVFETKGKPPTFTGGNDKRADINPMDANLRSHPVFKALQNVQGFLKGKNRQTGYAYEFHEFANGLRGASDAMQALGFEPNHTWYLAGQKLGELELSKRPLQFLNAKNFQTYKQLISEKIRSHPELSALTGRYDVKTDTDGIKRFIEDNEDTMSKEQLASEVNALAVKDIADAVTAEKLIDSGLKFVEEQGGDRAEALKKLSEIIDQAERFRDAAKTTGDVQDLLAEMGVKTKRDVNRGELHEEALKYYDSLSDAGKRYFSYYMLGSLRRQSGSYEASLGELRRARDEAKAAAKSANDPQERTEAGQKYVRLKKQFKEEERRWYNTQFDRAGYSFDFIPQEVVKDFFATMNRHAASTFKEKLSAEDVATVNRVSVHGVSEMVREAMPEAEHMNEGTKVIEVVENTQERIQEAQGKDVAIDADTTMMLEGMRKLLFHYPHLLKDFERIWEGEQVKMGQVGTRLDMATKETLRRFLKRFMYKGKFWHELSGKEKKLAMKRRYFAYDPESLSEMTRIGSYDIIEGQPEAGQSVTINDIERAPVMTKEGQIVMKPVKYTLSHFGSMTEVWSHLHWSLNGAQAAARRELELGVKEFEGGIQFIRQLGEPGEELFGYVSDRRQANLDAPRRRMDEALAKRTGQSFEEFVDYDPRYSFSLAADTAWQQFTQKYQNADGSWKKLYYTTKEGKRVEIDALEAYNRIAETQDAWSKRVSKYLLNKEAETKYIDSFADPETGEIDVKGVLKEFFNLIREGRPVPMIGLNGLYRLHHQMMLNKIEVEYDPNQSGQPKTVLLGDIKNKAHRALQLKSLKESSFNANDWMTYEDIPLLDVASYFPRNGHPLKAVEAMLKAKTQRQLLLERYAMDVIEDEIGTRSQAVNGNSEDGGIGETIMETSEMDRINLNATNLNVLKVRPTPAHHRGIEALPGWDKSTDALWRYETQTLKGYHNMLGTIMSQNIIKDFSDRNVMGEHTGSWAMFMKLYNRDNMGYPSTFPPEVVENREFKIGAKPYYWFTDQNLLQKAAVISKQFGLGDPKDPNFDRETLRKVRTLANLEAKWELISLLSHTKTMAVNLFDGSVNTAVSTGWEPWKRAADFKWLRENVFPEARSMNDLWEFAERHGSGESYINDVFESGTSGRQGSLLDLGQDVSRRVRGKDQSGYSTEQLLERNPGARKLMDAGAFFMRKSERMLRNQAWLAHYIKARQALDANGYTFKADDPWLIKMANRGVAGTQFLYNNAARPAFARTVLGRVFSRFQMYTWKSAFMRKQIYDMAEQAGFQPGTDEYEKLSRRATADLFMWALASVFPASMFGAALGGGLSQMKQASEFFFGNDDEKEKAFMGVLPYPLNGLQAISPPVMRVPYATFGTMMTGDWDRFMGYHVWTWFPFGRLANAAYSTYNAPALWAEKMIGIPAHQLQGQVTRGKKKKNRTPFLNGFISGAI